MIGRAGLSVMGLVMAVALAAATVPQAALASPPASSSGSRTQRPAVNRQIEAVEQGLRGPVQVAGEPLSLMSLRERMAHYAVPGVSIAVIENGRIAWARGYGTGRDGQPVTPATLFQAGSISKPVTALVVMREVQAGLGLDRNVNELLRSWQLPAAPSSAGRPVTLRAILSHGAGLSVHGFPGYEPGQPIPTLRQILDGQPPANTEAVRVTTPPGEWSYSGGGYEVVQQLLIDRIGQDFPALMEARLFAPLGMRQSSFRQFGPDRAPANVAAGHDREGAELSGRWRIFPEMAAAGLWTTPSDLARLAIAVQQSWGASRSGRTYLSAATARQMLTPQTADWGLGFQLEGQGPALRFRHNGDTPGFKALLVAYPGSGQGAIIMTNGDRGSRLIDEIILSIASAYHWPDYGPKVRVRAEVDPARFARLEGTYGLDSLPQVRLVIARRDNALSLRIVQPTGENESLLLPSAPDRFFRRDINFELLFAEGDPAPRLTLYQDGQTFPATRLPPN